MVEETETTRPGEECSGVTGAAGITKSWATNNPTFPSLSRRICNEWTEIVPPIKSDSAAATKGVYLRVVFTMGSTMRSHIQGLDKLWPAPGEIVVLWIAFVPYLMLLQSGFLHPRVRAHTISLLTYMHYWAPWCEC